jgi:hypothetical protein
MAGAKYARVLRKRHDDVLDGLVLVARVVLIPNVELVTARESDPQHYFCHVQAPRSVRAGPGGHRRPRARVDRPSEPAPRLVGPIMSCVEAKVRTQPPTSVRQCPVGRCGLLAVGRAVAPASSLAPSLPGNDEGRRV